MGTKIITLSLPLGLMEKLDIQVKREYTSRSEYIKRAVVFQLKSDGAFGDPPMKRSDAELHDEMAQKRLKKYVDREMRRFGTKLSEL